MEIPQEKQQQQQQLGIKLSYPTIPLLGICPEETITERDACNPMFIAALFTIAKTWKQPRRPMTHQWYIYEMEYYSPIKRNSFELVLIRWMKLDSIIPSEVSQKEKNKYHILTHVYMEYRKMVLMNLFARQQWRHRYKTVDTVGEGEGGKN